MRNLLIDVVGLAGLGCVAAGVYMQFGPGLALIVSGGLMLALALRAAARGNR